MKRRLTLHLVSGSTFSTEVDHDDAEVLLGKWRAVAAGGEGTEQVAQLDGVPVMHVDLASVAAITDELA